MQADRLFVIDAPGRRVYRCRMGEVFTNPEAVFEAVREVKAARELVCDLLLPPVDYEAAIQAEKHLRRAEVLLTLGLSIMAEEVSE